MSMQKYSAGTQRWTKLSVDISDEVRADAEHGTGGLSPDGSPRGETTLCGVTVCGRWFSWENAQRLASDLEEGMRVSLRLRAEVERLGSGRDAK